MLVAVYACSRSRPPAARWCRSSQRFDEAPLAYSLSALAAVVYIVATIALIAPGRTWYRIAWITIIFEFTGVLVVGTLSILDPELFPHDTVWSGFGRGYVFIPLVLPVLGMWWLAKHRPDAAEPASERIRRHDRGRLREDLRRRRRRCRPTSARSAVSIGKFDGVHAGHRAVIARLRAIAATRRLAGRRRHLRPQPARPARAREVPRRRS